MLEDKPSSLIGVNKHRHPYKKRSSVKSYPAKQSSLPHFQFERLYTNNITTIPFCRISPTLFNSIIESQSLAQKITIFMASNDKQASDKNRQLKEKANFKGQPGNSSNDNDIANCSRVNFGSNNPSSLFILLSVSLFIIASLLTPKAYGFENKGAAAVAEESDFDNLGLHYSKYLKEVVAALDKDQKFSETIKNMDANDIKSGKVAEQLKHVHEDVRKKLSDLKYIEIMRLKDLATRKNELEQHGEIYHGTDKRRWRTLGASLSEIPDHIGSDATHFDVNDLHKLMLAATSDLEKLDKERKEDYKVYEMEKDWQFQERLKMLNETEKAEAIKLRNELKAKHDDHPKVHEPGSKQHFEEVWEKKDHLPKAEFDPKTFFVMHDKNSDNYWDPMEVRELLVSEIQKLYDANNPEDDPNEMDEEYERMREHIYKEIDADKDGMISLNEFLEYSKKPEFKSDHGWEDVSKKQAYSKQDYEDFQKHREKYLQEMHGHYDPSYYANQPVNHHLPNWGYGMPAGVNPAAYYGYGIDPNHPQAQQILAQQHQQQQHLAYQQQVAYQHQQAGVAAPYQHAAIGNPQAFQQPIQNQQYQQPQIAQPQQPQIQHQQAQIQQQAPQVQQQQAQIQQQAPQLQQQQPPIQQQVPQQQPGQVQQQQPAQYQQQQQQQQQYQQPQQQVPQQQQQQQQQQPQQFQQAAHQNNPQQMNMGAKPILAN